MPPERSGAVSNKAATVPALCANVSAFSAIPYGLMIWLLGARSCPIDTMRRSSNVSFRNTVPSCEPNYAMPFRAMKLSGDASSMVTSQPR